MLLAVQTMGKDNRGHAPRLYGPARVALSLIAVVGIAQIAAAQAPAPAPKPDIAPARTLLDTRRGEDLLRGNGSTLAYSLSRGGIVADSVTVTRNGIPQKEGEDFRIDARGGVLTLSRPARTDETLVVRYRYTPGVTGLTGQKAGVGANGIAPTFIAGLPTMQLGKVGLGFVRTDDGGSTNALMRLNTPGLAFFSGSGGAFSQGASRSLVGEATATAPGTDDKNQYLIAQNHTIGGKGSQVTLNYQNVSKNFNNFSSLKQMGAAPAADIAQMEKERGLKRMGFGLALGTKPASGLQFSQNSLSGGGGDIERQSLSLNSGGLSLTGNMLSVDRDFTRFKDLSDKDLAPGMNREQFEKNMKGVTRRDLAGRWLLGNGLSLEGNLLDYKRELDADKQEKQKDTRIGVAFAPKNGISFAMLDETMSKTNAAGKSEQKVVRTMSVATPTKNPNGIAYTTRTTKMVDLSGRKRTEASRKAEGRLMVRVPKKIDILPGLTVPSLAFRGSHETIAFTQEGESSAKGVAARGTRTDTIATLFGVRTEGNGPLALNFEQRQKTVATDTATDPSINRARLLETSYKIQKSALFSYMSLSDNTTNGATRTDVAKESIALEFGRGYSFAQCVDKTVRTDQNGDTTELRTDLIKFSTDPNAPIYIAGERKETLGAKEAEEVSQIWRSGFRFGPLSLKVDGIGINRLNMPSLIAREKNIAVNGALQLPSRWIARYNFSDRNDKDPKSKLLRNEMLREWTLDSDPKNPLKLGFSSRTFENRENALGERVRQEATFTPIKPVNLAFLKGSTVTLAYGTDKIEGTDREGVSRKLALNGNLFGGNKLTLEWADGNDANGLPALSKAIAFSTRPLGRLRIATRQGLRESSKNATSRDSLWSRSWDVSYQIGKGQALAYNMAIRPERPDTSWEPRRTEQIGYSYLFGRGGKFVAEHRAAEDFAKKIATRSTLVSLVSPGSASTSYEFTYLREENRQGDKTGEMNTYVIAYQYLPSDQPFSVALGARWYDYGGDLPKPFDLNERTTATLEIKGNW